MSMKKTNTGLWIPQEIMVLNISANEKIVLSEIFFLSQKHGNCFAANQHLSNILNIGSVRTIQRTISKLKKRGLIEYSGTTNTRNLKILVDIANIKYNKDDEIIDI